MVKSWQIMEKLLPIKGESPLSAADVNLGCCLPFTLLLQMCDELEMKRVWHFIIIFLWLLFYTERKEREEKMCIFFRGDKIAWWTGEAEFMNMYSKCMSNEHHVMWWQNVIATAKFKYKSWRQLPNQTKLLEGCFPHTTVIFVPWI